MAAFDSRLELIDSVTLRRRPLAELGAQIDDLERVGDVLLVRLQGYEHAVVNAETGEIGFRFRSTENFTYRLVSTPAGPRIVADGRDESLHVFDAGGKKLAELPSARFVEVDASSGRMLTRTWTGTGWDRVYRGEVVDLVSGAKIETIPGDPTEGKTKATNEAATRPCAPHRKGRLLLERCKGGVRVQGGGPIPLVERGERARVSSIDVSHEGLRVAAGGEAVWVWHLDSGSLETTGALPDLGQWRARNVVFAPDGELVFLGHNGIEVWDEALRRPMRARAGEFLGLAISESGRLLAGLAFHRSSDDFAIHVMDRVTMRDKGIVAAVWTGDSDLAFGMNDTRLLGPASETCAQQPLAGASNEQATMCLYDTASLSPIRGFSGRFRGGTITVNSDVLAGRVYQSSDERFVLLPFHGETLGWGAAASPDGASVGLATRDAVQAAVVVIGPSAKKQARYHGVSVAFDPRGRFVAVGTDDGRVALHDRSNETPAIDFTPVGFQGGYARVDNGEVQIIGEVDRGTLMCAFGHYVLPFVACEGHMVEPDAVARRLDGARFDPPLETWPEPGEW